MNNSPKLQSPWIAGNCGHIEESCGGSTGEIWLDGGYSCHNCLQQLSDPFPSTLVRKRWKENLDV